MLFQVRFYYYFLMLIIFFSCKNVNQEKKITIGFSQCLSNDAWRQEMNKSMQIQADLFDNVHLEIGEHYPPGVYLLQLNINSRKIHKKLVKL